MVDNIVYPKCQLYTFDNPLSSSDLYVSAQYFSHGYIKKGRERITLSQSSITWEESGRRVIDID